jgi:hypothetical protein
MTGAAINFTLPDSVWKSRVKIQTMGMTTSADTNFFGELDEKAWPSVGTAIVPSRPPEWNI